MVLLLILSISIGRKIQIFRICSNVFENKKNKFVKKYIMSNDLSSIEYFDSIISSEVGNMYIYSKHLQIYDHDSIAQLKEVLHTLHSNTPESMGYKRWVYQNELKLINIGDTLKDFSFIRLDSSEVSFSDVKSRLIVVDFWYTTCFPCIRLMKDLPDIKSNFDSSVTFISLNNIDKDLAKVQNAINFHKLLKEDESVIWVEKKDALFSKEYQLNSYPVILIMNSDLVVLDMIQGYIQSHKKKVIKRVSKHL
jgi:thiol-disulfide isomerase/thioredoxin